MLSESYFQEKRIIKYTLFMEFQLGRLMYHYNGFQLDFTMTSQFINITHSSQFF